MTLTLNDVISTFMNGSIVASALEINSFRVDQNTQKTIQQLLDSGSLLEAYVVKEPTAIVELKISQQLMNTIKEKKINDVYLKCLNESGQEVKVLLDDKLSVVEMEQEEYNQFCTSAISVAAIESVTPSKSIAAKKTVTSSKKNACVIS